MKLNYKIHKKEKIYYWLLAGISLVFFALFFIRLGYLYFYRIYDPIFYVSSFYSFLIFLTIAFCPIFLIGTIRGNAVKVSEKQFPDLFELVKKQSKQLELSKVPSVYIMQDGGFIEAFFVKFLFRHYVVLLAPVLEEAYKEGKDTLAFIVGHELGHIKREHLGFWKNLLILPALVFTTLLFFFLPSLGLAYKRACEYTCDRIGYALSPTGAMKGIGLLAVGPQLYSKLDMKEWILNAKQDSGLATWLSELFSTHPHLAKRVEALQLISDHTEKEATPEKTNNIEK